MAARDPEALCANCQRRGTLAAVAYEADEDVLAQQDAEPYVAFGPGSLPPRITRFCRRCWPGEQARLRHEHSVTRLRQRAAMQLWAMGVHAGDASVPQMPAMSATSAVRVHWSLIPGMVWRAILRGITGSRARGLRGPPLR